MKSRANNLAIGRRPQRQKNISMVATIGKYNTKYIHWRGKHYHRSYASDMEWGREKKSISRKKMKLSHSPHSFRSVQITNTRANAHTARSIVTPTDPTPHRPTDKSPIARQKPTMRPPFTGSKRPSPPQRLCQHRPLFGGSVAHGPVVPGRQEKAQPC